MAVNNVNGPSAVAAIAMGAATAHHEQYASQDQYYDPNYYNYNPDPNAGAAAMGSTEVLEDAMATPYQHHHQMSLSSELGPQVTNAHTPEYHPYRYPDESYNDQPHQHSMNPQDVRYSQQSLAPPEPAVIRGASATGHNIHGYGSEDFSQNNHFLRELRE
jgi:hypothetical protein